MRLWVELIVSGLITGGIYALVAMGLNLQYGLMRILNVSHGEFLMLGAYLTYWAHLVTHANPLLFLPGVLAGLFGLGIVIHRLCFRRLAETTPEVEAFEARSLLVGFGLMFLVQNVALLIWGADLRGYQYLSDSVSLAGVQLTANRLVAFAGALVFSGGLILVLRTTLLGKAVRAMMQSPTGARLVGIDVHRLHPAVFGVGWPWPGWPAPCSRWCSRSPRPWASRTRSPRSSSSPSAGSVASPAACWAACCWAWSKRWGCT